MPGVTNSPLVLSKRYKYLLSYDISEHQSPIMSFTPIFSFGSAGGDSMDYDQIVPVVPVTGDFALDPLPGRSAVQCCRVFHVLNRLCLQGAAQEQHYLVVLVLQLNERYVHQPTSCT